MKIGIVAPAAPLLPETAERAVALADERFAGRVELVFHPQCFLSDGHFAGKDAVRSDAFLEFANDPGFSHLWFARGGYGSSRILDAVLRHLGPAAKAKTYMGYSDGGFLLAALYRNGHSVAHGPIPHDLRRAGGEVAVARALAWLVDRDRATLEPSLDGKTPALALNLTILSKLIGTPWIPDLSRHVLMIEEVSEHLYAIDRLMVHITANTGVRQVAGIRQGRMSDIPENDRPFGETPEEIVRGWCARTGIAFLGAADIGHDIENKVVPFGL